MSPARGVRAPGRAWVSWQGPREGTAAGGAQGLFRPLFLEHARLEPRVKPRLTISSPGVVSVFPHALK